MTTPTVPGSVTTLLQLEVGHRGEVLAILGHGECSRTQRLPLKPGVQVLCLEHTADDVVLETPDGHVLLIPHVCAGYVQIDRAAHMPGRPVRGPGMSRGGQRFSFHR